MKNRRNIIEQQNPPENSNDIWLKDGKLYRSTSNGWQPMSSDDGGGGGDGNTGIDIIPAPTVNVAENLTFQDLNRIYSNFSICTKCILTAENKQAVARLISVLMIPINGSGAAVMATMINETTLEEFGQRKNFNSYIDMLNYIFAKYKGINMNSIMSILSTYSSVDPSLRIVQIEGSTSGIFRTFNGFPFLYQSQQSFVLS